MIKKFDYSKLLFFYTLIFIIINNYIMNKKTYKKFIKEFNSKCYPYKYIPASIKAKRRIVVFGDIHGDYDLCIDMLKSARLINNELKWIGLDTYVVQVGDQIDRCRPYLNMPCSNKNTTKNDENSDIKIMELFNRLMLEAQEYGGNVISLLGNHELMNSTGYLDYVSYEGIRGFEQYKDPIKPEIKFHNGYYAREHAFKAGNEYGKMMGCTRNACIIIGSNLFVHAGIIDALLKELNLDKKQDLENINIKIKSWLLGLIEEKEIEKYIEMSETSMFWTRFLGKMDKDLKITEPECKKYISNVLETFKIGSIIIGHTPQSFMYETDLNSTCDGSIWRVDNGSSKAFDKFDEKDKYKNNRRLQWLEILNDNEYYICDKNNCYRDKILPTKKYKLNRKTGIIEIRKTY